MRTLQMRRCAVLIVLMLVAGCVAGDTDASLVPSTAGRELIDLPEAQVSGGAPLPDVLARRRSVRDYQSDPLGMDALSQLLWAAQGVTSPAGQRTAPSAGGLYPLELYVVTGNGRFHYLPNSHRLEIMGSDDVRAELSRAALSQEAVEEAPATFVVAAVYARTEQKYGERAERYVKLEAGHAAQNLLLQAVALGLGAVPIGAFDDGDVQKVLGLPGDHEPLYLIPVGHPAG